MDKKKEERVPVPLRMSNELYKKIRYIVNNKKDKERGLVLTNLLLKL